LPRAQRSRCPIHPLAGAPGWRPIVLGWNAFGLADFILAVAMGATSSPTPLQIFVGQPTTAILGTMPYCLVPALGVPILTLTHILVFMKLGRSQDAAYAAAG
jgi:hypothetical protein